MGDTVTVSDGSAGAVLGDSIATLSGQTLAMKHPGFTLLKDSSGAEFCFGVYEAPGGEGDVFLFNWTANGYGWASAAWVNLTGRSDRTYPNHEDDVAMILNIAGGNYRYLTVPASGITVGQLIVGMTLHWTLNHVDNNVSPLVFSRTDGGVPAYIVSRPTTATGLIHMRVGEYDKDSGDNALEISFTGPEMLVDLCGDTRASSAYARKGNLNFAVGRSRFQIGEGQTLRMANGTENTGSDTDYVEVRGRAGSGFFGDGTLEMDGLAMTCALGSDKFVKVGLYRTVTGAGPFDAKNTVTRFTTRFNTIPSIPIEILSAFCPTTQVPQTAFKNYWVDGIANAWLSPDVLLSGCNYEIVQNGAYAPHWDFWDVTNVAEKVTIRGHVGVYGAPSYTRDNTKDSDGVQRGRVTHHVHFKDLERADPWSTMRVNGLNFNRGSDRTNDIKGTLTIDNWSDHIVRPPNVDPADYTGTVYPVIPWMTVHCNDNSQGLTDTDWGTEHTFPGVREEDGCVRLVLSQNNRGSDSLTAHGENENFYFCNKQGFWLSGSDRRLFSLVYSTQETPPYAAGGNFYLDSSKGGHKLYITSGAMAVTRKNKWLGQPVDMTRNGRIVLEGNPSYLHAPSVGLNAPSSGSNASDYNMCWVPLEAAHDLVKGGEGSIGLAGDQRGIQGTLVVNGGELWLGYPAYKKNGYLYTYANTASDKMWPMHGCATDCDFRVRGGAVLALASAGYKGVDSDGNDVDAPVIAYAQNKRDVRHTITLERSGNATGGVYLAEADETTGLTAVVWKLYVEDETGKTVTLERGTWGSSESDADHKDDTLFAGPGVIRVQDDDLRRGMLIILR